MKNIKLALCAMFVVCFLTIGAFADGPGGNPGGTCRDGQTPIAGKCSDGNPPGFAASDPNDSKAAFEDFLIWVKSLF